MMLQIMHLQYKGLQNNFNCNRIKLCLLNIKAYKFVWEMEQYQKSGFTVINI